MRLARFSVSLIRLGVVCVTSAALLSGCGWFDDEEILEGDRVKIRVEPDGGLQPSAVAASLPEARTNTDWTQTNGAPTHNSGHLAGPTSLREAWSVDAGSGADSKGAITSAPIVVGGVVYAMDSRSILTAFDASTGNRRWQTDLSREGEKGADGFGGGLAADSGLIFAATGFGEVLGIQPGSGDIVWRTPFGAPFRSAPGAINGLVVAVTRDNTAVGIDGATGKLRWRLRGAASTAGLLGGASPAFAGPLTLLPFATGELVAAEARTGRRGWSAVLTGGRKGLARSAITDVSGDPVVVGPYIIAANQSGRMISIDGRAGQRAWTRNIGSAAPIWAAGESLFLVSDDAKLMRLSVQDGSTVWEVQLPAYGDEKDREDAIAYSGPVVVSGRAVFTDSEGNLHSYDAETGQGQVAARISGGSITGPVVANGTVYVLSDNGRLHAFR